MKNTATVIVQENKILRPKKSLEGEFDLSWLSQHGITEEMVFEEHEGNWYISLLEGKDEE